MTLISWQNGPIFRNGAVGTEQACCCTTCSPRCYWAGNPPTTVTVTVTMAGGASRTFSVPFSYGYGTVTDSGGGTCTVSVTCTPGATYLQILSSWTYTFTNPYGGSGTGTYTSDVKITLANTLPGFQFTVPCNESQALSGTYSGTQTNFFGTVLSSATAVFP